MGESERYLEYKNLRNRKRFAVSYDNNAIVSLFAINIFFFLLMLLIQVGYFFGRQTAEMFNREITEWLSLPNSGKVLWQRPWTLLTYMFCDTGSGLMRLVGNMLWLWSFGYILQRTYGNDKIIPMYLYGGVAGALLFVLSNDLSFFSSSQPNESYLLGANAAVMGVATYTTTLTPNYRVFTHIRNGFPLWILFSLFLFIDIIGISPNMIIIATHSGGILAGFLIAMLLKRDFDCGLWMNRFYHWATNVFTPSDHKKKKPVKQDIFYTIGINKPFKKQSRVTQQRIDEILDKINESGYNSLSEEEKKFLKKASEEDI